MGRFIALLISMVRIDPEAPTRAPATIRASLPRTKPVTAAAIPVKEFSRAMITGMSAPPTGRTDSTPRMRAPTAKTMISTAPPCSRVIASPMPTRAPSSTPLISCWRGQVIGVPRIHSWSLAKAIRLPLKLIPPIRQLSRMVTAPMVSSDGWPEEVTRWKSPRAIRAAAPAPIPLKRATSWGMAVIATRRATTMPTRVPRTAAGTTYCQPLWSIPRVTPMATSIPIPATRLPRNAVLAEVSCLMPRMKRTMATR